MDPGAPNPLLRSFERHLRAENRSDQTVATYLIALRQAEAFLTGSRGTTLGEAGRADLEAYLGDLLTRRAPATAATYYKVLKLLYQWLEDEDELPASPMAKMRPPIVPDQPVPVIPDDLWVPDIGFASCDLRVLMDQSAEAISSPDPPRRRRDNWHAGSEWRRLRQGAMRAMAVVVIGVLGQHHPQLPAAHDQHPVQHLPPNRAHPALRVRIRPRRPHRRGEHLDRLGDQDGIERGGELGIPIADQKSEPAGAVEGS
jgi:hypothetical protein